MTARKITASAATPWSVQGPYIRSGNREFWTLARRVDRGHGFGRLEDLRTASNRQHKRFYSLEAAVCAAERLNRPTNGS